MSAELSDWVNMPPLPEGCFWRVRPYHETTFVAVVERTVSTGYKRRRPWSRRVPVTETIDTELMSKAVKGPVDAYSIQRTAAILLQDEKDRAAKAKLMGDYRPGTVTVSTRKA